MVPMQDKTSIRQQMRQTRRNLTPEDQLQASIGLLEQFRLSPFLQSSMSVGAYLANDGEIDPSLLVEMLQSQQKRVALPCIDIERQNSLKFAPYQASTQLVTNQFGIKEPQNGPWISPTELDLVLLPLVAFDLKGNRLGMGGGFYDRAFSFKQPSTGFLAPRLVGLAHECQQVTALRAESWDIPLDGILTNKRYIEVGNH